MYYETFWNCVSTVMRHGYRDYLIKFETNLYKVHKIIYKYIGAWKGLQYKTLDLCDKI